MSKGYWYAVVREDGKQMAVAQTRHDAVGMKAKSHCLKNEWIEIEPIKAVPWWSPRMTLDFDTHGGIVG